MDLKSVIIKTINDTAAGPPSLPSLIDNPENVSVDDIRLYRHDLYRAEGDLDRTNLLLETLPCALQFTNDDELYEVLAAYNFIVIRQECPCVDVLDLKYTGTEQLRDTRRLSEKLTSKLCYVKTTFKQLQERAEKSKYSRWFFRSKTAHLFRVKLLPLILPCIDGFIFLEKQRQTHSCGCQTHSFALHFAELDTGEIYTHRHQYRCKADAMIALRMFRGRTIPKAFFNIISYQG